MATYTLSILRPSVNNLSVRIMVRAAGLDCDEIDMWGNKGTPEFLAKDPADLTPLLEESGLPNGSLWESCAIMQYLCNKHGLEDLYPTDPGRRAMVDSAMFYVIGTLYPLIAQAQAQKAAIAALERPLAAIGSFFFDGDAPFIGGEYPSIADIRLAASLEFLAAIDYELPAWATRFMSGVESTLGDAYSEPAGDVRGFIASVQAPVS
jgi:glutathione S-transferase